MEVTDPKGKKTSAYYFLRDWAGLGTASERARMLEDALGQGHTGGLGTPSQWLDWGATLVRAVVNKMGAHQQGQYSLFQQ
jgi:hypothetical protein